MQNYDKRGKFFLGFSVLVSAVLTYMTVQYGFTKQNMFIVAILFFIFTSNAYRDVKGKRIYYAIGDILMGITVFIVFIIPAIIGIV